MSSNIFMIRFTEGIELMIPAETVEKAMEIHNRLRDPSPLEITDLAWVGKTDDLFMFELAEDMAREQEAPVTAPLAAQVEEDPATASRSKAKKKR